MKSILNKGRCSRCIASKKELREWLEGSPDEVNKVILVRKFYLFCQIKNDWCKNVARFVCKEPPMGISVEDYEKTLLMKQRMVVEYANGIKKLLERKDPCSDSQYEYRDGRGEVNV